MIAHLGMYLRPETRATHDRFWNLIRQELGQGPHHLSRDSDFWRVWRKPSLLLAQTCGMPYRTRLHDQVTLVGTPDYGLPECPPGYYNSVFITREDHVGDGLDAFAGARFAYNESLSQSGWAAPITHAEEQGVRFGPLIKSGAHRASAQAVAAGEADIAALDAVTWDLLRRFDGFARDLREICRTRPTPGLPYITAKTRDPAPIFAAVASAIDRLSPEERDLLMLQGVVRIPPEDYMSIPTPVSPRAYSSQNDSSVA